MSQIHCCLGEFCIHRKLLRVDFDSERICKWARSTWIELDRAFWSALLSAISERGGAGSGSWVPGWIFYTTCLMFLKAGCIFCATLLVFKKLLLQKWAHFSVYCYTDLRNFDKTSKLTIKLALPQQIFLPQSSQMQYSYSTPLCTYLMTISQVLISGLCFHSFVLLLFSRKAPRNIWADSSFYGICLGGKLRFNKMKYGNIVLSKNNRQLSKTILKIWTSPKTGHFWCASGAVFTFWQIFKILAIHILMVLFEISRDFKGYQDATMLKWKSI